MTLTAPKQQWYVPKTKTKQNRNRDKQDCIHMWAHAHKTTFVYGLDWAMDLPIILTLKKVQILGQER